MSSDSHYAVLGVSTESTTREIKLAYHRIALQHHPDRGPNADVDQFRRALNAHTVLSDPAKRQAYDRQLRLDKVREERQRSGNDETFNYAFPNPPFAQPPQGPTPYQNQNQNQNQNGHGDGDAGMPRSEAAKRAAKAASSANVNTEEFSRRRRPERTRFDSESIPEQQRPYPSKSHRGKNGFSGSSRSTPEPHSTPRQQQPQFNARTRNQSRKAHMKEAFNAETVIDLTGSTDEEEEEIPGSVHAPDPLESSSDEEIPVPRRPYDPFSQHRFGADFQQKESNERHKRSASAEEPQDSPAAKRSRFDMSGFRGVPPFTQTNGNFDLNSVSGAMPAGPARMPRQLNRKGPPSNATGTPRGAQNTAQSAAEQAMAAEQLRAVWDAYRIAADQHFRVLGDALSINSDPSQVVEMLSRLETVQANLQQWVEDSKECSNIIKTIPRKN